VTGAQAAFTSGARVEIIWKRGIPLRTEPRPDAPKLLEHIKAGVQGSMQELRADWLQITLDSGQTGWARWYYDVQQYIAVTGQ
jgi:SH3-like domain-containing protein